MAKKKWTPAARKAFALKMKRARAAAARRKNPGRARVHTKKFDRTVAKVKRSLKRGRRKGNAYAIASATLGERRSVLKRHRRRRNPAHYQLHAIVRGSRVRLASANGRPYAFRTPSAAQDAGRKLYAVLPRGSRIYVRPGK